MGIRKLIVAASLALPLLAAAAPQSAGMFKRVEGEVKVQRGEQQLPASVGMPLYAADTVLTGRDGAAGITFDDNTLMSLGPSAKFVIDRFQFNSTTHDGAFESTLRKGRLAVVSGKIAKHQQDAMKVRTPSSVLGVRGTEFIVEAE
ncbi:hypothetical protein D0B54_20840 [Solimonas sp. K1W22B-7]|uniref:FecR family protein n=1 Tax=Solimonas sp. K1W22B-7 TaxID=2303331 RepID=UPI000E333AFD|nr:FecR domain-containing protein [Solimonas sp. K1W22B-7]AXQ30976.1 hypothetical protein D0B54_20840 [Solimonas sp. K1W22B-7]